MRRWSLFCLACIFCAGGCINETRTFTIYVHNGLDMPVTICITKTHGPDEPGWMSPEDLAAPPHPATDNTPPGIVIPPGKTAVKDNITGRFDRDLGRATLRIYAGTPNLSEMNAISQGSINRLDLPLDAGWNGFKISREDDGRMNAAPVTPVKRN